MLLWKKKKANHTSEIGKVAEIGKNFPNVSFIRAHSVKSGTQTSQLRGMCVCLCYVANHII